MPNFGQPYNRETVRVLGADPGRGLILAFHGLGGSPKQLENNSGLNKVGDQANCGVVYIQSMWRMWRFWGPTTNWHMQRDLKTVMEVLQKTPHLPDRVYAIGFSAGGNFVIRLADLLNTTLAGVIVYAGEFKVTQEIKKDRILLPRLLSIGNESDKLVPFEDNAQKLAYWWKLEGSKDHVALMKGKGGHEWDQKLNPFIAKWINGEVA